MTDYPVLNPITKSFIDSFILKPTNSLLITGEIGIGKLTVARDLATKLINKSFDYNGPKLEVLDFSEIIKSKEAITDMNKNINFKSIDEIEKIFILDNFEMASIEAYNAFLKTLEEPPVGIIFILLSPNKTNLPLTIISRVKQINILKPPKDDLINFLIDKYPNLSKDSVDKSYLLNSGLPGRIINVLDQNKIDDNSIVDQAKTFLSSDNQHRLIIINQIYKDRKQTILFLEMIHFMASTAITNDSKVKTWPKIYKASLEALNHLQSKGQARLVLLNLINELI